MNPYIDEDLQAIGEHARRFATDRVAPGFLERDDTRVLDRTLMREMGELGFIAPELPEAYGGQGMGCLAAYSFRKRPEKAFQRRPGYRCAQLAWPAGSGRDQRPDHAGVSGCLSHWAGWCPAHDPLARLDTLEMGVGLAGADIPRL